MTEKGIVGNRSPLQVSLQHGEYELCRQGYEVDSFRGYPLHSGETMEVVDFERAVIYGLYEDSVYETILVSVQDYQKNRKDSDYFGLYNPWDEEDMKVFDFLKAEYEREEQESRECDFWAMMGPGVQEQKELALAA